MIGLNVVIDMYYEDDENPDFRKIKDSGIVGLIHKATEGTYFKDPIYIRHREAALAAGLMWGAYHYGMGGSGVEQAKYFLDFVKPGTHDLVALDYEKSKKRGLPSMTIPEASEFISHLENELGRPPIFYGGGYLKDVLGDKREATLAKCPLWLAQYGPRPEVPKNWTTWTIWQYAGDVKEHEPLGVPGIKQCDRNTFNGDMAALKKLWGG